MKATTMGVKRPSLSSLIVYLALIAATLFFLIPLLIMVNTSLKSPVELVDVFALPSSLYVQNFADAFDRIGRGLFNSLMITFPATVFSVFVGSLGAFPLSQFRFRGDNLIYTVLICGMFLPFQVVLIPLFQMIRVLGLYDSYLGLWIVHTAYGIPLCLFFMRNFFTTIPSSLFEAALVDGCSMFSYYFRVLMPLSKAGLSALVILQFRSIWNEFLFGLSLTRSATVTPVTVQLATFVSATDVRYGALMAATIVSILATTVVFFTFQKQFLRGIVSGATKG